MFEKKIYFFLVKIYICKKKNNICKQNIDK